MAVSPKFNFTFKTGESAFNQLMTQFIGIRTKENKERYERELKAADPKAKAKYVRDLIMERNKLVREMQRMYSAGSVTERRSGGRGSGLRAKYLADNQEEVDLFERGRQIYAGGKAGADKVQNAIADYNKVLDKDPNKQVKEDALKSMMIQIQKAYQMDDLRDRPLRDGARAQLQQYVANNLDKSVADRVIATLNEKNPMRRSHAQIYAGGFSDAQEAAIAGSRGGGGSTITQKGRAPSKEAEALFKQSLEDLNQQIKEAQEDLQQSKSEYSRLLRGPDYNMALAPTARRPSLMGEIIEDFTRLNRVDPSYARDFIAAGDEPGRFEAPKPYQELLSIKGAEGKSPFEFVLEQTDMIAKLKGGALDDRALNQQDAELILSNVGRMSDSLSSPMFNEKKFGTMRVGANSLGLSEGMAQLNRVAKAGLADQTPEGKIRAANFISDTLRGWEGTLSKEEIESTARTSKPTAQIASYIGEATDAYNTFLDTRDASQYRKALSSAYNKVAATDPEVRGLVGDAFLNEIERFGAVDESQRLPEELNFKLSGLKDAADELAARSVLTVDVPELPYTMEETRGPRGDVRTAEDFEIETEI